METTKKDALARARELFETPFGKLPKLALAYFQEMNRVFGACGDVGLTAFAHYAQLEEGLPCADSAYRANKHARRRFAKVKASLRS